jgi:CDP-diacylglycerol--serine O-phosphatidyltransferase
MKNLATMTFKDRLIDPRSPDRRPRRAAYALPTMFTAGNVFLGFYALIQVFIGAMKMVQDAANANLNFQAAAIAIGVAVFLDGLDGRIARMTNTTSDFGREMDSLADVISFGIAPAVLAFVWGVEFVAAPQEWITPDALRKLGYFFSFMFLLCGAMRLARFNITKNPVPKNPGKPDRKYFVGVPIPAGAAMIASIVYFHSAPITHWGFSAAWLALLGLLSYLMICTWRYPSFKDLSLTRPRSPLTVVLIGILIYLIWTLSQYVLLIMSIIYVLSGIVIRVGGILRRRLRSGPGEPQAG